MSALSLLESLKYNGQIYRFFDAEGIEYDLVCASAEIARGNEIVRLKWTICGYHIDKKFNHVEIF